MSNPFLQNSGVFQVVGPPGTGKTTWLISTVTTALQQGVLSDGKVTAVHEDDITVVAFTRAAAVNAWQRLSAAGIDLPEQNIGTLHSLTLRAMIENAEAAGTERPRLVRDMKGINAWNERYPERLMSVDTGEEETVTKATETDKALTVIDGLRARMIPVEEWPVESQELWALYDGFKQDEGLVDFTDLIHTAIEEGIFPRGIGLLLADEAQDFSPLEWKLLHQWTTVVDRTALIGDDDQAIYGGLKGASPEHFVNLEVPDSHRIVLSQSYRVPALVHAFAENVTSLIGTRLPKTYRPRDETGSLRFTPATWMRPMPMLKSLQALEGTVMILAYSKFQLEPTLEMLRAATIPYHNPYRPAYGAWNPLGQDSASGITARTRLRAFMKPEWTTQDLLHWTHLLKSTGVFPRGMRNRMKDDLDTLDPDVVPDVKAYFEADAYAALMARDLAFFTAHLSKQANNSRMKLCLKLAQEGLLEHDPRIVVGTIHSVKGGEADTVILFPDYPEAATDMDENLRVMYVGATRALKTLVVATAVDARGEQDAPPEKALSTQRLIRKARQTHAQRTAVPAAG